MMSVVELTKTDSLDARPLLADAPFVSIIITHFNYSGHLADAIHSVIGQTHRNWECVVVDDCSDAEHCRAAREVVSDINNPRVSFISLDENVGQIGAFFAGFEKTTGDFVCLLDPDDRYTPTFLEEAIGAHLNIAVMCPMVCTDQLLVTDRGVIGGGYKPHYYLDETKKVGDCIAVSVPEEPELLYTPASVRGWHWTTTSAMMFRRAALNYLRPHKKLAYKRCADGYLAKGAHALGGSLFLRKALIQRTLHDDNSYISANIYSSFQRRNREGAINSGKEAYADVLEAIKANGGDLELAGSDRTLRLKQNSISRHMRRWRKSLSKRLRINHSTATGGSIHS